MAPIRKPAAAMCHHRKVHDRGLGGTAASDAGNAAMASASA
jgi:hypothetical protein